MEKMIIDERTGWEYELQGYYYPTGRVMRDGRMQPETVEKEITETLKENNQMIWVQRSNNIYDRAREIVNNEIIYN